MLKRSLLAGLALSLTMVVTGAIAANPLKIVYIGKNTGNPYFDSITGGFKDACAKIEAGEAPDFCLVVPAGGASTDALQRDIAIPETADEWTPSPFVTSVADDRTLAIHRA